MNIDSLSCEEIKELVTSLVNDPECKEKTKEVFSAISDHDRLEVVGEATSVIQMICILDTFSCGEQYHHPKLSPVIVGLRPKIFAELLTVVDDHQMEVLKHEAMAEPIQYQLSHLFEVMSQEETSFTRELQALKRQISTLEVSTLTTTQLRKLTNDLADASKNIDDALRKIDRALILAWNTDRPDLVDNFTQLKEYYHNDNRIGLGHPAANQRPASGLYATLDSQLTEVYGNDDDDKPTIEALAKLSIWYLKDYWDIGLLRSISDDEKKLLSGSEEDPNTREQREHLRQKALEALAQRGLSCVGDFKKAKIFSKPMLAELIQKRP